MPHKRVIDLALLCAEHKIPKYLWSEEPSIYGKWYKIGVLVNFFCIYGPLFSGKFITFSWIHSWAYTYFFYTSIYPHTRRGKFESPAKSAAVRDLSESTETNKKSEIPSDPVNFVVFYNRSAQKILSPWQCASRKSVCSISSYWTRSRWKSLCRTWRKGELSVWSEFYYV